MSRDTRPLRLTTPLRVIADELQEQITVLGDPSKYALLKPEPLGDAAEHGLPDPGHRSHVLEDRLSKGWILRPQIGALEPPIRRLLPGRGELSSKVDLLAKIPLVVHLAVASEMGRALDAEGLLRRRGQREEAPRRAEHRDAERLVEG